MNLLEAIDSVKMYLHYDGADNAIKARLDVMIPRALNNARVWAERKHTWAMSHVSLWYRVPADTAANLYQGVVDVADVDDVGATRYKMRSVTAAFLQNTDASLTPLLIRPLGAVQRLRLQRDDLQTELSLWPERETDYNYEKPYVTVNGTSVAVVPATACVLKLEGFKWMEHYPDQNTTNPEDVTDFFLEYLPDVLIWKAVIDCNYITQTFVNRQDGNVGVPKDMLADAWDSAIDWDAFQHQHGINYQLG